MCFQKNRTGANSAIGALMRVLALPLLALAACTTAQQDRLAQDAAKQAIRPVLAERLPGVPVEPAVDCVIENASANEILVLAADAVTGPTASTVEIVTDILARPDTITCLATEGLPVLIGQL
ncbi:MAG: hypothetical protein OXQ30_14155 [Boseongicola sp.]|nr:hypothetical protein [Boseongicola sp.]